MVILSSRLLVPVQVNLISSSFLVSAALQSIFPQTELGAFMVLLKRDKEQQLNELTMIVTGIRLFNKASNQGEGGIHLHELSTLHQPTDMHSYSMSVY